MSPAICFNLDHSKILSSVNGLNNLREGQNAGYYHGNQHNYSPFAAKMSINHFSYIYTDNKCNKATPSLFPANSLIKQDVFVKY